MPGKPLIDGADDPIRDPFLSDEDKRVQIVGNTSQILFFKSLQDFHNPSPLAIPS